MKEGIKEDTEDNELDLISYRNEVNSKYKDELPAVFVPEKSEKKEEESAATQPVPFYKLFRYATWLEAAITVLGVVLGTASGCCMPIIIILYGEFTTLLVDRNVENKTSTPTALLRLYGGGTVLANGSLEERHAYLVEDSEAFGVLAAITGLIQMVLGTFSIAFLNYSAQNQISRVRKLFLQAIMRQDMAWCDTHSTANFASQLTEDLDKLQEGIGEKIGIFMFLLSTFVSSVIMSFVHGWKLTLVVLCCAPVIIAATAVVAKVQSSLSSKELESYGNAGAVVEEALSSIRTVVAFGGEEKEVERYTEKLQPAIATGIKRGLLTGVGGGIMWFIVYCSYAIAFWYGVDLILQDRDKEHKEYTPAILVIVLFGVLAGAMNMGLASPHLEAFAVARGSAAAVYAVIERRSAIDSLSDAGEKPFAVDGNLRLSGVHFNYPARPQVKVLQDLDLEVRRGETVALVGSSGCGKSTVLQLVQRLYDPQQGTVYVDGTDAKQMNVGWLRSHIGVVGQEPVLFAATISENIRYGRENASQREIVEAARQANAHEFISKLPQGYDTMVGERGAQLSGGQKQRIAIARALVRNPTILLLDEATSALDMHSEAVVQDALDKARRGRTTLVVAHRLSTIISANRIVYISDGHVVEQGTHDELMAIKGHYWSQVTAEHAGTPEDGEDKGDSMKILTEGSKSEIARRISTHSLKKEKDVNFNLKQEDEGYAVPFRRVMALTSPEWLCNLVGCLAALVVGSALPGFAVLFGEVYRVLSLVDVDEILYGIRIICILFVVIGLVTGFGTFFQMYAFGKAGVKLTSRLRVNTLRAILRQEMGWFDDERHGVGVLCARLSGDAASVHGATGTRIGVILQSSATMVIGVILGLYYSWKMTLVSLVTVPLVFGGIFGESKIIHSEGLQEKQALESATKIAVEAISSLSTVASLGAEKLFIRRYETELVAARKAAAMKTRLRGVVFAFGQSSPFFGYALSLYYGGVLVATEGLPYQNIIKVSEALIFGAWTLGQALAYVPSASLAKLAAGRLFKLIDRKPLMMSTDSNQNWMSGEGGIEYSRVKFSYPTRPGVPVLQGLDLLIQPGKSVALVGPSGCGKSTCIQLLQRFYDPSTGTVSVNHTDVQDVPLRRLRSQLGLVSQEPTLFDRTIAENIAYGDNLRAVPVEDVIEAAKKANIHNFITSLPQGYETRLGAKGTHLSGGQKQRIAIARALVRNPRILLLDEATSALDTHSQKVVQGALDKAQEGRTCITIAHRLVTVQQADVICVISQGAVAEAGSHAELLARGGLYSQMVRQAGVAK